MKKTILIATLFMFISSVAVAQSPMARWNGLAGSGHQGGSSKSSGSSKSGGSKGGGSSKSGGSKGGKKGK